MHKKSSMPKLGILVVHGIGSPLPGDTLTRFADALEVEGYITHREDLVDERRRNLPEKHRNDFRSRLIRGGPLPVQRAYGYPNSKGGSRESDSSEASSHLRPVILAEAFWSDITQLPGGIAGVLRGYFDIFFNLIALIKSAVPTAPVKEGFNEDQIKKSPKLKIQESAAANELLIVDLLGWLSRFICMLISGPIACANLLIILIFFWMWLCAPFFFSGENLLKEKSVDLIPAPQILAWAFASLTLGFIAYKTYKYAAHLGQKEQIGPAPTLLKAFCISTAVLILVSPVEFVYDYMCHQGVDDCNTIDLLPIDVAHYVIVILGGFIAPLLITLLALSYWIYLLFCITDRSRPNLEIVLIAPLLQTALWILVVQFIWELIGAFYPKALYEKLHHHIPSLLAGPLEDHTTPYPYHTTPYPYFEWSGLRTFSLIVLLAAAVFFVVARSCKLAAFQRVIVNWILASVLSVLMIFAAIHVMLNTVLIFETHRAELPWLSAVFFDDIRGSAWDIYSFLWPFEVLQASPAVLMFALSFGLEPLRQGLSLVDEVVSYMQYNGAESRRRVQRWFWDEFEAKKIKEANNEKKPKTDVEIRHELWEEIENRRPIRYCFNHALHNLLHDYNVTHLIIVSHSQGTVIALDELIDSYPGDKKLKNREENKNEVEVHLVTMGSPIHHIYQHYFPSCYPPFLKDNNDQASEEERISESENTRGSNGDEPQISEYWKNLVLRVDRWVNLYRTNDFVGTTMDLGEKLVLCHKEKDVTHKLKFKETNLEEGGHSHYWTDKAALAEIGKLIKKCGYGRNKKIKTPIPLKKEIQPRVSDA